MQASALHTSGLRTLVNHPLSQRVLALVMQGSETQEKRLPSHLASEAHSDDSVAFHHITVLRDESVSALQAGAGKIIVDCTLGGGGHSEKLLAQGATVYGIDQDEEALEAATQRLAPFGDRFQPLRGNFRDAASLLAEAGVTQIDGLLADIGVSSHQIDTARRGFSFQQDGPLDMRMDPSQGRSAADWVNEASEQELLRILWDYGEEKAARAIVRGILAFREKQTFSRTSELVEVCAKAVRKGGSKNPATRTFQALRIAVNDELGALESLLHASIELLKPEGRLAIISFHSLEDRMVKNFLRDHSQAFIDRPEWPEPRPNPDYHFRLIQRKPIAPGDEELQQNPRARSSKLRVAERIARP